MGVVLQAVPNKDTGRRDKHVEKTKLFMRCGLAKNSLRTKPLYNMRKAFMLNELHWYASRGCSGSLARLYNNQKRGMITKMSVV
jgi:hypothetical protein